MKRPLPTIFITAIFLLALYVAFVQLTPFSISTAQNQNDTNLIRVQDYLRAPNRQVVLVGSSLTFRLPQAVLGPDAANLALAGDGPRTGLHIVRDSGARPRLVLVESNLLLRKGNEELVRSQLRFPEYHLRKNVRAFRTGYDPVNLLWRGLVSLTRKADDPEPVTPPQITRQLAELQRQEKARLPDPAQLRDSLADTKALVEVLQARGIKVGFLEMPIDPSLMNSPFDEAVRRQTHAAFPASQFCWIDLQVPGGAHTLDGVHLTQQDAILIARQTVQQAKRCR